MSDTLVAPATKMTTTSNDREYEQFTSHGKGYDTLAAVVMRISELEIKNMALGRSDGRVTEQRVLLADLETFAEKHGAKDPKAATQQALDTVIFVHGHVCAPTLSVLEEMEIAICHSNMK